MPDRETDRHKGINASAYVWTIKTSLQVSWDISLQRRHPLEVIILYPLFYFKIFQNSIDRLFYSAC